MPTEPEEQVQRPEMSEGSMTVQMFMAYSVNAFYLITVSEYPKDPSASDVSDMLAGARNGMVKAGNFSVVREEDNSVQGVPGKLIHGRFADGPYFQTQICVHGRRLYAFSASTDKSYADSDEVNGFFESFRLH